MRTAGEFDPVPWHPLGDRVQRSNAAPSKPEWQPLQDNPQIERNQNDGHLRTNIPLPKGPE